MTEKRRFACRREWFLSDPVGNEIIMYVTGRRRCVVFRTVADKRVGMARYGRRRQGLRR